jgi:hypothetical protein
MKAPLLILIVIGSATLLHGTGYASSPGSAPERASSTGAAKPVGGTSHDSQHVAMPADRRNQSDGRPSEEHRSVRGSVGNHALSHGLSGTTRPLRRPNSHGRSTSENAASPHQPGQVQPARAEKGGLIRPGADNKTLGIPQRAAIRPTTLSLTGARHRGANAAAIGGTAIANSGRTNNSTINGTGMHRRP